MYKDFSQLFHQNSKDLSGGGTVYIPKDESLWPEEWKQVYFKTYPLVRKHALPVIDLKADLAQALKERSSTRTYTDRELSVEEISTLLLFGAGKKSHFLDVTENKSETRTYPSGGGRYGIEIYPLFLRSQGHFKSGVYHYNVHEHALDVVWERDFLDIDYKRLFAYPWVKGASLVLVFAAVFERSQMKYGERGYRYVLLEAGHIGQNVTLVAQALGLGACPLGGVREDRVEELIDIDGVTESVVYTIVIG